MAVMSHYQLLRPISLFTISQKKIDTIRKYHPISNTPIIRLNLNNLKNSIRILRINDPMFTAWVMVVSNPKQIHVAVTKYRGILGETVQQMVMDHHAIAGVNAGLFDNGKGNGQGGRPVGIVISDGKYIQQKNRDTIIGFTKEGELVCGKYSTRKLMEMNLWNAVSFGPVLIQKGEPVTVPAPYSRSERTAIGQRADGSVIFVVTDGRLPYHLGATFGDLQKIMMKFHAVTAANLDGGTSSVMVYRGNTVSSILHLTGYREIATAFIVYP
jgi:exopolysaccharide biosynthesis protein